MKIRIAFLVLVLCQSVFASITGRAYLEGQSNHQGIIVIFKAFSPIAVSDSVITQVDGSFSANIKPGVYQISFKKPGYQSIFYNNNVGVLIGSNNLTLNDANLPKGVTIIVSGDIFGVWESNNIYLIQDTVFIPANKTLVISPNTVIKFDTLGTLIVYGNLISMGKLNEPIIYTSSKQNVGRDYWNSIKFRNEVRNSKFEYSIFENCKNCIDSLNGEGYPYIITENSSFVRNCEFRKFTSGIGCGNNILIEKNLFYDFTETAINSGQFFNPYDGLIKCNKIYNGGKIAIVLGRSVTVKGNEIEGNSFSKVGITYLVTSTHTITNNFISGFQEGISPDEGRDPYGFINGLLTVSNNKIQNCKNGITIIPGAFTKIENNFLTNNMKAALFKNINNCQTYCGADKLTISNNILTKNTSNDITINEQIGLFVPITKNSDGYDIDSYNNLIEYPNDTHPSIGYIKNCTFLNEVTTSERDSQLEDEKVSFYPNPAHDFLTIKSTAEIETISIWDNYGKKILITMILDKIETLHLKTGIYHVSLDLKNGKTTSFTFVKTE